MTTDDKSTNEKQEESTTPLSSEIQPSKLPSMFVNIVHATTDYCSGSETVVTLSMRFKHSTDLDGSTQQERNKRLEAYGVLHTDIKDLLSKRYPTIHESTTLN